jgi:ATP diphosphatase
MKKGPQKNEKKTVEELLAIMARLRSPSGCPWDREQTEQTLKPYLLEEAYEALEAVETGTPEDLKEELGDILLQIVFMSQIAAEKKEFQFADVVHTLAEKLIRRHPHIFSTAVAEGRLAKPRNGEDVKKIWKKVKKSEGKPSATGSLLDSLPLALPALEKAERIAKRVSRVGFDWPDIGEVWKKVEEELEELKEAKASASPVEVEKELGDLFLALTNWARFQKISAEEAVRKANRRFSDRFRYVERALQKEGRCPEDSSLEEMERLWNRAKKKGKEHRN